MVTKPSTRSAPRSAKATVAEALLREVLVGQATLGARFEGLEQRVDGIQTDAREARDAARDSAAATRAQDIPAALEKLKGDFAQGVTGLRSDMVNGLSTVTREMREVDSAQDKRIAALEAFRNKIEGASGFVGWVAKNLPWLVAVLMTALAAFGIKGK